MKAAPVDVVLLGAEWRPRALLRAQLIEAGLEVVATDTWSAARRQLRPGAKPRLIVVDLQGLPEPERVLSDLRVLMKPERIVVLSALGTVEDEALRGFHVIARPIDVGRIAAVIADLLHRQD